MANLFRSKAQTRFLRNSGYILSLVGMAILSTGQLPETWNIGSRQSQPSLDNSPEEKELLIAKRDGSYGHQCGSCHSN